MPAFRPHPRVLSTIPACVLALSGPCLSADREPSTATLPSITAEHVRLHVPSDTELARVRIELSPDGMRASAGGRDARVEIVQDFVGERLWFVDRERRVAHSPTLIDVSEADASGGDEEERGMPVPGPDHAAFLGVRPCGSTLSRAAGSGTWRGRVVDVRRCLGADASLVAIVFVDREHGIVVRRETVEGIADELRDVRPMRFAPGHFVPSARFRRIDERELLRGAPTIGAFREDDLS